jgi:hypothetical protein
MNDIDLACQALFTGQVNVPSAAGICGLTTQQMKEEFLQYVALRSQADWELDIQLCWPYT